MVRSYRSEIVIGLIVLVIFVLGAIFFSGVAPVAGVHSLRSWQEADAPPGYPIGVSEEAPGGRVPQFPGDFVLLDGFARFALPPVSRLDWPAGAAQSGVLTRSATEFLAENEDGERHLGIELAPLGSGNWTDGGLVRAAGNGLVVSAGERDGPLGRIVVIGHRLPGGDIVHSLYGRLASIEVAPGALVARGQEIGTAEAAWHFELYDGALIDPGDGFGSGPLNRRDPAEAIARHRPASADDLSPEPLAAYEAEEQAFRIGPDGLPVPIEE